MSDTVSVLDLGCYAPDRPVLVTATDPAAPSREPVTQIAAPGPVGPQHAPSPVMAHQRVRMEARRAGGASELGDRRP